MKLSHLLYALICLLLIGSCKKNDISREESSSGVNGGTGKSNPTLPTEAPQLLNFKINGASCAYDSLSVSYYYPVAVGTSLTSFTVNYDTTAAVAIYIDNLSFNNYRDANSNVNCRQ